MIWTKKGHWSAKFQTFNCSLLGTFCWKYIKFQLKKVQRSYTSWQRRLMQNLKTNQFVISKMTRILWILIRPLKNLKNLHFDWSLSCKVYNTWPKKVQRSYLLWHWRVVQNLKKNRLGKWQEEFAKFSPEDLKCQNFEVLLGSFFSKWKMHELKIYRGVMCDDTEEWGIWQIFTSMKIVISF